MPAHRSSLPLAGARAEAVGPLLIVTRPAREGQAWVRALRERGLRAEALPLIDIGQAPDPQALARRRALIAQDLAVMFVSANAVRGFFAGEDAEVTTWAWPPRTRAWATGPGTAAALLEAGVPAAQIDQPPPAHGRFDSEALWDQVQEQVRMQVRAQGPQLPPAEPPSVLIVRGADADGEVAGRAWLAQQLQAAGARVDEVAAYRRALPDWGPSERALLALAQAPSARASWHFSSSEAVANLRQLVPEADWSGAQALCTHARIAEAARAAGFGRVAEVAPRPESAAAFLQSHP